MRTLGVVLLWALGVALVVALLAAGTGVVLVRGSLPTTDGRASLPGLEAPVTIQRDTLGVPVITGEGLADVLRGQGFVHGQDRFFQMDLLRRQVAGELAELVGEAVAGADRTSLTYDYRTAAERHLEALPPRERELLEAYVEGVNAGLASLGRRPPEYLVLRAEPRPWRAEDSILAFLHFYTALSTHYQWERHLLRLEAAAPEGLFAFLTPGASRWDRPVVPVPDTTGGYEPLPIPGPEVFEPRVAQRSTGASTEGWVAAGPIPRPGGSNAWAIPTGTGAGLLANDPHLPFSQPGVWHRAELRWGDHRVAGVVPPGLPGIFAGMTEELAWGVTAALVDQTDLVVLEMHPEDSLRYRTPDGWADLEAWPRELRVRGQDAIDTVRIEGTTWGPVRFREPDGTRLVLRTPAHDEGGVRLSHLEILEARSLEEAMEPLRELGGPGISLLLAEASGRVGWIVTGVLPNRVGTDGQRPSAGWGTGEVRWDGMRDEDERPMAIVPAPDGEAAAAGQALQTANQRLLPLPDAAELSHVWMSGVRSHQIRRRLDEGPGLGEADHLALQLDATSPLHLALRDLLVEGLDAEPEDAGLHALRERVKAWGGTAAADDAEFPVVHRAWQDLQRDVLDALLAPVREADPGVRYLWPLSDEVVFRVLEEQPEHLVPGGHDSWRDYLHERLAETARELGLPGARSPAVWGESNRARIRHPFGAMAPALGRFLDLAPDPLDGWAGTIRANLPDYGQSFRMVARPGAFEAALFQMPGGQSGHPLSPWYRAGHEAWLTGEAAPLVAGPAAHELLLEPD